MKRSLWTIFPCIGTLFIFCGTCVRAQPPQKLVFPRHTTAILPPPNTEEIQTQSGAWDVSDVDISAVNPNKKQIAFTFDDAVSMRLENLLAIFAAFNETHPDAPAFATVFCNGIHLNNENTHTLSAAFAMGWEIGNHGFSHADLTTLSFDAQQAEIDKTDVLLQAVDGKPLHLFRAPYGKISKSARSRLQTPVVAWNVDTLDWSQKSADEIYQSVMQNLQTGNIVLMHDGPAATLQAVKRLLPDLYAAGYQPVSVSMLAKTHAVPLKNGGEYIRIRKNGTS